MTTTKLNINTNAKDMTTALSRFHENLALATTAAATLRKATNGCMTPEGTCDYRNHSDSFEAHPAKINAVLGEAYSLCLDMLFDELSWLIEYHEVFGEHYLYVRGAGAGSYRQVRLYQASTRSTARAVERNIAKYVASTAVIEVNLKTGDEMRLDSAAYDTVLSYVQQYLKDSNFVQRLDTIVEDIKEYLKAVDGTATLDW